MIPVAPLMPLSPSGVHSPYPQTNICFTTVQQNGDWYGADAANIYPDTTSDGTPFYSYWANSVTGEFVLKFGAAGNTELTNVSVVIYQHNGREVGMSWDDTNKYYSGNDLIAAQYISSKLGEDHCFNTVVVPSLLQWFQFDSIGVE